MNSMKQCDGSRRHVLDWVETPGFLDMVRSWVHVRGLSVPNGTKWMPKSWSDPIESRLFDPSSPFLTRQQKTELQRWWLTHQGSANIPNWDLLISAKTQSISTALVLVEAKAHVTEFDCRPKPLSKRNTPEAQKRTDENHGHIGVAIDEACRSLANTYQGIHISRDCCYQLSNRLAMAWKLASMGITTVLVFLGFTGDRQIASEGDFFADDQHWQRAFTKYTSSVFPSALLGKDISCGATSFCVIVRSLPVARLSRPIAERRLM